MLEHFKNVNIAILIATMLLSAGTLLKVFQFDSQYDDLKEALEQSRKDLNNAATSNEKAQMQIQILMQEVTSFENKKLFLQHEIDSIILAKRNESSINWDSISDVIQLQSEKNNSLDAIRIMGNQFQ